MWNVALIVLAASLHPGGPATAVAPQPVREETTVTRDCMTEAEIFALLEKRGYQPVGEPNRDGHLWGVLTKRSKLPEDAETGTGEPRPDKSRTGAYVVIDGCSGEILQINKAILPDED